MIILSIKCPATMLTKSRRYKAKGRTAPLITSIRRNAKVPTKPNPGYTTRITLNLISNLFKIITLEKKYGKAKNMVAPRSLVEIKV